MEAGARGRGRARDRAARQVPGSAQAAAPVHGVSQGARSSLDSALLPPARAAPRPRTNSQDSLSVGRRPRLRACTGLSTLPHPQVLSHPFPIARPTRMLRTPSCFCSISHHLNTVPHSQGSPSFSVSAGCIGTPSPSCCFNSLQAQRPGSQSIQASSFSTTREPPLGQAPSPHTEIVGPTQPVEHHFSRHISYCPHMPHPTMTPPTPNFGPLALLSQYSGSNWCVTHQELSLSLCVCRMHLHTVSLPSTRRSPNFATASSQWPPICLASPPSRSRCTTSMNVHDSRCNLWPIWKEHSSGHHID